ncbi:MAG TPA: DUF3098 domain-containing protein [Ginsengibacter sp.]
MATQPIKKVTPGAKAPAVKTASVEHSSAGNILFTKENYKWMVIGLVIMALGFFLMAGGKSADPKVFNDNDIYSPMRITVAPILIVAGLLIEIFAIMKKPK